MNTTNAIFTNTFTISTVAAWEAAKEEAREIARIDARIDFEIHTGGDADYKPDFMEWAEDSETYSRIRNLGIKAEYVKAYVKAFETLWAED